MSAPLAGTLTRHLSRTTDPPRGPAMTAADLNVELAAALMVEESTGRLLIHAANAARRYVGRELSMDQVLLELGFRASTGDLTAARLVAAHREAAEAYTVARIELADLRDNGILPTTRR